MAAPLPLSWILVAPLPWHPQVASLPAYQQISMVSHRLSPSILCCLMAEREPVLVTYLSPGGKPGDVLKGTALCDKSK